VFQGEVVYREAQQELSAVGQDATRGFTDLRQSIINHTRSLSLNTAVPSAASSSKQATGEAGENVEATPTATKNLSSEDAIKESETVLSRLRDEAAKRLKDLQKAEDAADEALLRFGSNLRDFLRDAIKIAPPGSDQAENQGSRVLFESKDAHGKRVIHTSRFDAQLHVIHTSPESFVKDGSGAEFETWTKEFDIDKKTADISSDLEKYPELRATMEKLVPDQVPYADFWKRYYFLRHGIETAEARRRDLLKGM
jgi:septation ring formation regulator EzrA